jgi:hypothetical protein
MSSLSRILDFGEEKMAIKKAMGKNKKQTQVFEAPEESYFWVFNGPILRSIQDLGDALGDMTKEQFEYHTKRNGNDFAAWIKNVFNQDELAKKIARLKSKRGMQNAIKKFLN